MHRHHRLHDLGVNMRWLAIALAISLCGHAAKAACPTHPGCDDGITATTPALIASKRAALINTGWGAAQAGALPATKATQCRQVLS